ncbi:hypothetical protein TB2_009179 [Malus domestica]
MNDERGRLRSPIHFFCIVVNDTDKVDCGSVMKRRWYFGSSVGENLLVRLVLRVMYVCLRTRVIPIPSYEFGTESILFSVCGTQISFFVPGVASVEVIGGHRVDFHDDRRVPGVASVEVIGGHRVDFHDGKWVSPPLQTRLVPLNSNFYCL